MNVFYNHLDIILPHKFVFLNGVANVERTACIDFVIQISHAEGYAAPVLANARVVHYDQFQVLVVPSDLPGADKIDDKQIEGLSADIAKRIQDEMTYPGQVKITVIRETRSVSYAK